MEVSPFLASILKSRGLTKPDEIDNYLNSDIVRDWNNPYDISGMEALADRVEKAMREGSRILIYGDYDLDGMSSTAVMMRGLREIDKHINAGMTLDYFIPSRFDEGYGLSEKSIKRLSKEKPRPDLIITVDCGITSDNEIKLLNDMGVDVVVTDHHAKSDNYPQNCLLIDPEANDEGSEDANLAGVGVALKLICVLCGRLGMPHIWRDLVDLATLGTLADYMPLLGQNRSLVAEGIKIINEAPRPAIRAILDVCAKQAGKLTSTDITYIIVPRLNAAGRLNKVNIAVDLLLSDDYAQAYQLALQIENFNNQRKDLTEQIIEQANYRAKKIIDSSPEARCLILSEKDWHPGVIGIAAAKIAETYSLPTIVFSEEDGMCRGSGRSVGDVDLHLACMECYNAYEKFGGHKSALGITIRKEALTDFQNSLQKYLEALDPSLFKKSYKEDMQLSLHDLTVTNISDLALMEPFGNSNEEPIFRTDNVFIKRGKAVGVNKNHLSCTLTDGAYGGQAIMFNVDNIADYLNSDSIKTAFYNARVESFNGNVYAKMHLKDLRETIYNQDEQQNNNKDFLDNLYNKNISFSNKDNSVGDFICNSVNEYQKDVIARRNNISLESNEACEFNINSENQDNLQSQIIEAMIGKDGRLHESQEKTLNLLREGKNVLSVMPTGRGKSLIFQVFASMLALSERKMSIFVYPLRALIADQAFHLQSNLEKFNLNIRVLNGETPQDERNELYQMMSNNQIDIMLTTPEFLAMHIDKISNAASVGFVVVDEAHHLGGVKIGDRSAYGHMPKIFEKLQHPQVLALSATVSDEICKEIQNYLPVKEIVKDDFERSNLYVDDRRNIKSRDDYLVSICASGEKTVIYVNSRQQTVDLARMIKSRAPHVAMQVGFYNAGMTKADRKKIEQMFRNNTLSVLVATSAFGEGVNIPDIRHVCLYHLPFSNVEFNQMAGRCGRDNMDAIVHLLYNRADATINTQILTAANPGRDELGKIYIWLKNTCNSAGGSIQIKNEDLIKMEQSNTIPTTASALLCALNVFAELKLISLETFMKEASTFSKVSMPNEVDRVELEQSSRFCEGQNEVGNFEEYRHTAMRKTAQQLQDLLRHPILPN